VGALYAVHWCLVGNFCREALYATGLSILFLIFFFFFEAAWAGKVWCFEIAWRLSLFAGFLASGILVLRSIIQLCGFLEDVFAVLIFHALLELKCPKQLLLHQIATYVWLFDVKLHFSEFQ